MGFMIVFRPPSSFLPFDDSSFFFRENAELVHEGIGWVHGEDVCGFLVRVFGA